MLQEPLPLLGGLDNGPLFAPLIKVPAARRQGTRMPGILRRACEKRAVPTWFDPVAVRNVFKAARELTLETGVTHSVDHIVPLVHPLVCGLHVQNNLVVRPLIDNIRKGNRYWPDMPGEQGELEW